MAKACLKCTLPLEPEAKGKRNRGSSTYGICHGCASLFLLGERKGVREFLDQFPFPILLMAGGEPRTHVTNRHACDFLGKSHEDIEGKLGGDMLECVHARKGGGCGNHVHCQACAIRKSVLYTYTTGKSLAHVPATIDLMPNDTVKTVRFLISTEKVGDGVIVHLGKVVTATVKANAM